MAIFRKIAFLVSLIVAVAYGSIMTLHQFNRSHVGRPTIHSIR